LYKPRYFKTADHIIGCLYVARFWTYKHVFRGLKRMHFFVLHNFTSFDFTYFTVPQFLIFRIYLRLTKREKNFATSSCCIQKHVFQYILRVLLLASYSCKIMGFLFRMKSPVEIQLRYTLFTGPGPVEKNLTH